MDELIDMVARVMRTGNPETLSGDAAQAVLDACSVDLHRAARLKRQEEARAIAEQGVVLVR